jgi:monoamine oxidase
VDPSTFDVLGQPVNGRLLLAGEHTGGARTGYADGAYSSGLRAASMLAGAKPGLPETGEAR